MFSPEARPALATENFAGRRHILTKYGDFPPQKAAILPEEFHSRPADKGYHPDLQKVIDKHGTIHSLILRW